MTELAYFFRLPTKDVAGVGSALQRNTAVSFGIYTNQARTAPYLASVWADAAGTTPKTNPVAQNVGGNNGFDGYLPGGIRYFTRMGSGATAVDSELFAASKHFREGASFGHDTIRTETGLDVGPGYSLFAGRNYALEAINGPLPWAQREGSGSYVNGLAVLDFWWDHGYRRLFLRDGLRLTGGADPPEFNFTLAGSFNEEYPDGGPTGTGGPWSRVYQGAGGGFFGWLVWPGTPKNEYGPRSAIFSMKTYANTAGSVTEATTVVNGQPLGYREAPSILKHEATGTDTGDYGKFQWDGVSQWVHQTTGTAAPAGTALYPAVKTGSGYQLNRLGLGAIFMFATGAVGSSDHPTHHVRIGPGKKFAVFSDSIEGIGDGPTQGPAWFRSSGDNNVGDGVTDIVAHFDRNPTSIAVGQRVGIGFGIDSTNRPLASFLAEFRNTTGSPHGAIILAPHLASLTPTPMYWFTQQQNVGVGADGTSGGGTAYGGGQGVLYAKNRAVAPSGGTPPAGGALLYPESGAWKGMTSSGNVVTFVPTSIPDYTVTNANTRRSFDTTTVTLQQLAEVVGTLIADDIANGYKQ